MTSGNRGSMPAADAAASAAEPSANGFYLPSDAYCVRMGEDCTGVCPDCDFGKMTPRIGSLCSGYGGLDLGLMAVVGGSVAWHVEYDKHPSAVLDARFPGVPNYGDVTTTDWTQVEPVDWLTAGYPCQPFSHAGKRRGSKDERHLWPAVADAIGVLRPGRVLLENVAGHISLGLDAVLADLAALGYDATWGVVRAADAGAPHGRARIFIVADAAGSARRVRHGDDVRARRRTDGSGTPTGRSAAADAGSGPLAGAAPARNGLLLVAERGTESVADTDCWGRSFGAEQHGDPASAAPDWDSRGEHADGSAGAVAWGDYEPAVRRWERVTGRPAPRPTEPGRTGERLSPRFVEWLMGLPDGWVTSVLSRNPALKCLGNGVVPQQAALALKTLLPLACAVAA